MKLTLLRSLLALPLVFFGFYLNAQSPQGPDCNVCNCTVAGNNLAAVAADACIGPTTINVNIIAGATYRRFNTTPGNIYRVSVCGATALNTVMHIRENTGSFLPVMGACDDDGCGVPGGASAVVFRATQAVHRVYLYTGICGTTISAAMNITITCQGSSTPPPNDEPCNAQAIPLNTSSCTDLLVGTTEAATPTLGPSNTLATLPLNPNNGCGAVNYAGSDVWYSVTVPPSGFIGISIQESGACATAMGLYTTTDCVNGPYQWLTGTPTGVCVLDGLTGPGEGPGIVFNPATYGLAPGATVYIRVWERNGNENGSFTICAYNATPPPNDDPCGAVLLNAVEPCAPVEYSNENSTPLQGVTLSPPSPSCGNPYFPTPGGVAPLNDVWFRVVVPPLPANGITVSTIAGTWNNWAMAWYRLTAGAICGTPTLTQITGSCSDNQTATNLMPRVNSATAGVALTPGETIYIRVWPMWAAPPSAAHGYYGTFSICVTPNVPPVNDDPCGAIALDVNGDCILSPATIENATNTPNAPTTFLPGASTVAAPTCGVPTNGDVWFTVNVPSDLMAPYGLNFDTDDLLPLDLAMAVYRDVSPNGCASQLQLVQVPGACSMNGSTHGNVAMPALTLAVPVITPGERLYVRVWRQNATQGTFSICVRRTDPLLCQGTVYDSGGPNGTYNNGENVTQTYCSAKPGDVVTLTFSQFNIEAGWDFLAIYNGPTAIPANLIGNYTGTNGPGTVSATITGGNPTGCLTVVFTTDLSVVAPGYTFKVSCSPPVPPPPAPVGDCGLTIYDPGGPTGFTYPGNLGVALTSIPPYMAWYCPNNAGEVVTLNFSSFDVETFFDGLYIFADSIPPATPLNTPGVIATQINSGNGAQGVWSGPYNPPTPPNGAFWGTGLPGSVSGSLTSTYPGCITLAFFTDAIVSGTGWQANVTCGPPPPPPPPCTGPDCNRTFFETVTTPCTAAGVGNYANNANSIQTLCATPGQLLNVTFEMFQTEANWDKMYVFDGPTTASPMIASGNGVGFGPAPHGPGAYWGSALPGPFTASTPGGCLTFHFVSDGLFTAPGWRARAQCVPQVQNDNPCTPVGATVVTPNTSCIPLTYSNMNTTPTLGVPPTGCGNYQGGDVWFRFTAPPSGRVFIDTKARTLTDAAMALYSATACGGPFTLVECDDDDGEGLMPAIDRMCNPLVPGGTYWLRVYGNGNRRGTFDLCIVAGGGQTTLQSDCNGAFSLCSNTGFTSTNFGSGCTSDIAPANWGCLSGGERQGSWYAFRVQGAGNLAMTITPSTPVDIDWAIWLADNTVTPPTTPVGANCLPDARPVRCSFASQQNTINSGGVNANPAAATGMGRHAFIPATAVFAAASPFVDDVANDGWVPGIAVTAGQMYILFVDDHHLNGEPYTVAWSETSTPTAGLPVMGCELLPVEALVLQGKPNALTVDLTWTTASEMNNSHFVLERSADGTSFEPIGIVNAVGYSHTTSEYRFNDGAPFMGLNYYRLQQVDHDGTVVHSNVVSVLFEPKQVSVIVVPNPTRDRAELIMNTAFDGVLNVRILDGSGRTVASFLTPEGVQRVDLPIQGLEAGSYTVQLISAKGEPYARGRFVKQ